MSYNLISLPDFWKKLLVFYGTITGSQRISANNEEKRLRKNIQYYRQKRDMYQLAIQEMKLGIYLLGRQADANKHLQLAKKLFYKFADWDNYCQCSFYLTQYYGSNWEVEEINLVPASLAPIKNTQLGVLAEAQKKAIPGLIALYTGHFAKAVEILESVLLLIDFSSKDPAILEFKIQVYDFLSLALIKNNEVSKGNDLLLESYLQKKELYDYAHPSFAFYFIYRGIYYGSKGIYQAELENYEKALNIFPVSDKKACPLYADLLEYISCAKANQGYFQEAQKLNKKAIKIRQNLFGKERLGVAKGKNIQGDIFKKKGKLKKALARYYQAQEIFQKQAPEHYYNFQIKYNLAQVYESLGQLTTSIKLYKEVFANQIMIFGSNDPLVLMSQVRINDHLNTVKDGVCLAKKHYEKGEKNTAKQHLDHALELMEAYSDSKKHILFSEIFNLYGRIAIDKKAYKIALTYFQKAIINNIADFNPQNLVERPTLEKVADPVVLIFSLQYKAICMFKLYPRGVDGNMIFIDSGFKCFLLANQLLATLWSDIKDDQFWFELIDQENSLCEIAINQAYEWAQNMQDLKKKKSLLKWALAFAEQRKALILLDSLSATQAKDRAIPGIFAEELITHNYTDLLKKKLPPNTVVIQYYAGQRYLFIYLIDGDGLKVKRIKYPQKLGLKEQIESYLKAFEDWNTFCKTTKDSKAQEAFVHWSDQLYQLLIKPIKQHLPKPGGRLVIIPDGPLLKVPFETLLQKKEMEAKGAKNLPFLVKKYEVQYHFLIHQLLFATNKRKEEANRADKALVVAIDDFRHKEDLSNLKPIFRKGLDQVYDRVVEKKELRNSAALHQKVVEEIPKFNYIILYTHGRFVKGEPRAVLWDKDLKVDDLYALSSSAKLIALVCCGSGLGNKNMGEGIDGFNRAFLRAGASNILSAISLKVVEEPTQALLNSTILNIIRKMPYACALREAKLELINQDYKPIHWAPFVLMGPV